MLNVHLRINDTNTRKPTPVRLRVTDAEGTHFAPLGHSVEFPVGRNEAVGAGLNLARELWFPIDGACEIPLPAGVPLRVQATKGPAYHPIDETVTLGAGQLTLRLPIQRWAYAADDAWLSVDTRCHFLTPHDALLEAAAEGIDVVNLLATVQRFPALNGTAYLTVPNLTAFSGQVPALERDGTAVVVNTFNVHPVLGSVGLLNSHRPVFPLTFGGDEPDDWGICDWCDQCHRKGGLRVWVDAFEPTGGLVGGEALIAAILGKIDAIEVNPGPRKVPLLPWVYRLWNAGVLVPLVGGSGKDSNKTPLGAMRTYARVEPNVQPPVVNRVEPVLRALEGKRICEYWVAAIRAGRSFVTNGPMFSGGDFRDPQGVPIPGSGLAIYPESVGRLIHSTYGTCVQSLIPFDALEIIANGQVLESSQPMPFAFEGLGSWHMALLPSVGLSDGWTALRCHSAMGAFAHTSPIAVGAPVRDPSAVAALVKLIEQTREWAEQHGRYVNAKRRDQLLARCNEAIDKLRGGA